MILSQSLKNEARFADRMRVGERTSQAEDTYSRSLKVGRYLVLGGGNDLVQ